MLKEDKLPGDALSGEIPQVQQKWYSPAIVVGMRHVVGAIVCEERNREAAVVIRRGYIVLEEERGKSSVSNTGRVASCSKAVCATVLAIASEQSQEGHMPHKVTFDDHAFDFIPWAHPLSDPRKARITVKQLLNHTSGIRPEATDRYSCQA